MASIAAVGKEVLVRAQGNKPIIRVVIHADNTGLWMASPEEFERGVEDEKETEKVFFSLRNYIASCGILKWEGK